MTTAKTSNNSDKISQARRKVLSKGQEMSLESGQVQTVTKDGVLVLCQGGAYLAKRAFSCLVELKVHDVVLCAKDAGNHYSVLAVIDRPKTKNMTLAFPANVNVHATEGEISLLSQKNISLNAADSVKMVAGSVDTTTPHLSIHAEKTDFRGDNATIGLKSVKSLIDVVESVCERIMQKTQEYLRVSSGHDEVHSSSMRRKVKHSFSQKAENNVIRSEKETKIDGKRIHLA